MFSPSGRRMNEFFLLLDSTDKKRERLISKAVCAVALTSGGLRTTDSVARMLSAALRRPYTAQPSIPASMVTSCACVSTWMAWTVELEDTLLCLFTWCRAIMIASLSGHLPEGSPLPSWTNPRAPNFVSTSARPLLPSPVYWPFSGQQLRATTRGMATWSLLRSSTSAILSTLKTIPCWFVFRLIIEEAFAPIQQLRLQSREQSDLLGCMPCHHNSAVIFFFNDVCKLLDAVLFTLGLKSNPSHSLPSESVISVSTITKDPLSNFARTKARSRGYLNNSVFVEELSADNCPAESWWY